MAGGNKLPGDYAIDALSIEADRRRKVLGRAYSYGQLVADTTQEERERIVDTYRAEFKKKKGRGCTHSFFHEADTEDCGAGT